MVTRKKLQKLIGCKWIFKRKIEASEGDRIRYKARLVAKGYNQREGIDYNEIFSPVVKHSSIRMLMALVARNDWELHQLDVKTAFLHGELEESIYMEQPEGFVRPGDEDKVCLLKRSIYGLKQSSRQWNLQFDQHMKKIGFESSKYDSCVYVKKKDGRPVAFLLLYVDDMLVTGSDINEIQKVKHDLKLRFEMKDLGEAKRILGIDIIRDRRRKILWMSQQHYIEKLLKKYQMNESRIVSTPLGQQFQLSASQGPKSEEEQNLMKQIPYASIIGSVMYVMICTRPDLAHAVSITSRYMSNPGKAHWQALKWMLRYLRGSADYGIMYRRDEDQTRDSLEGYCDSDYATNRDNRKSQTGYIFTIFGSAVTWKSNLQSVVALSTTEAEYIALTDAVKQSFWLKGIMEDFGVTQKKVAVNCDSSSAICLSKHQTFHDRSKHIDVRLHFIRDEIGTDHNPADALTKVVPASKFNYCLELVNVLKR